jgi:putative (di)nucleoside polyphosphate hydrolase
MTAPQKLPYRTGVGIMLIGGGGLVFVAKRIDMTSEAWQMPQGGVDEGETPIQAAKRELMEETGTDKAELLAESRGWYSYDLPDALVPKIWGGRYRGQRQKWFAMRFTGDDRDINIRTAEPEFSECKWVKPETLPDIIVPFKRKLYGDLLEEFSTYVKT